MLDEVVIELRTVGELLSRNLQDLRRDAELLHRLARAAVLDDGHAVAALINLTRDRLAVGDLIVGLDERLARARHIALLHRGYGERTELGGLDTSALHEGAGRALSFLRAALLAVEVVELLEGKRVRFATRKLTARVDGADHLLHLLGQHCAFVASEALEPLLTLYVGAGKRSVLAAKAVLFLHALQCGRDRIVEGRALIDVRNRTASG